jgi:hypothetical protein
LASSSESMMVRSAQTGPACWMCRACLVQQHTQLLFYVLHSTQHKAMSFNISQHISADNLTANGQCLRQQGAV